MPSLGVRSLWYRQNKRFHTFLYMKDIEKALTEIAKLQRKNEEYAIRVTKLKVLQFLRPPRSRFVLVQGMLSQNLNRK